MDKGIVYIGMDLGTFKTSVASSAGVRDVIHSAVGRPKDHVARSLLGRDVVFGKDIFEHRLAPNIIRPFEKGVLKYNSQAEAGLSLDKVRKHKEAARLLVEHAVALTRDLSKTFTGSARLLEMERAGRFPGGPSRRRERRRLITQMAPGRQGHSQRVPERASDV